GDRTASVTVTDLDVTFVTLLGAGNDPVRVAGPGEPAADIRIAGDSDLVISLAQQPMNIARAYFSGKVKIEASMKDIFRLRRLL
ncbi:MAG TPA: SCP2 sterol-binding domain-containing protein, partial [Trebonia sp.]